MNMQIDVLVFGGIISIISSIVSFFCQQFWLNWRAQKGELKIYAKTVYDKVDKVPWGFYETSSETFFIVPLWIEIQNTKSIKQIVRDVNLGLFLDGRLIKKTIQINSFIKKSITEMYGDNGSYSFLIDANEIGRYDLSFILRKSEIGGKGFDEVKLMYFDLDDNQHAKTLFKINDAWKETKNSIDEDWRRVF